MADLTQHKYSSDARQVNFRLSKEYCDKLIAQSLLPAEFDRKLLSNVVKDLLQAKLDNVELIKPEEVPDLAQELTEMKGMISKLGNLIEGKSQPQAA